MAAFDVVLDVFDITDQMPGVPPLAINLESVGPQEVHLLLQVDVVAYELTAKDALELLLYSLGYLRWLFRYLLSQTLGLDLEHFLVDALFSGHGLENSLCVSLSISLAQELWLL